MKITLFCIYYFAQKLTVCNNQILQNKHSTNFALLHREAVNDWQLYVKIVWNWRLNCKEEERQIQETRNIHKLLRVQRVNLFFYGFLVFHSWINLPNLNCKTYWIAGLSEQYCYDNFSPVDASAPSSHSALLFSHPAQPAAPGSPGPSTLTCRSDVLIIGLIWFLVWKTARPSLCVTYWAWSSWSWLPALVRSSRVSFCLSCSISACRATNCCSRACETKTASDESSN